ncbi:unnamed protein product [Protopolystoma xenopodis]|uniref:FH2 domain-containing protein n=1 Tax=Protopolystoma xenopodis TaxID=117903 RepID=A0A448X7A1_9PLAT|nr:unnamed protein product [Protopolystoma xenopodis]
MYEKCLGVLLRFLESEKYNLDRLRRGVEQLELSQDVADRLIHQLPTQEEAKLYLHFQVMECRSDEELTDEDRLLLHLCKIDRLGPRLELIIFMNSFEDTLASLIPMGLPMEF